MRIRDVLGAFPRLDKDTFKEGYYKFTRNRFSVIGLILVLIVIFLAIFAPFVTPYPQHASSYVNFKQTNKPPSWQHFCGTDLVGRDVFSRIIFAYRYSLVLALTVLALVVPPGILLGLIAGYYHGTWVDYTIMRITDVFLAVPPLILALAVTSVLGPSMTNAMMAVSLMWWPWYVRLVYGLVSSLRNETYVHSAQVIGASRFHILWREILPNCMSSVFTKMSLDVGWVIMVGAALSFVGLGAQSPTPDLGSMISDGAAFLPDSWWMSMFPSIGVLIAVLGFNLLGDGLRDLFALEEL